LVLLEAFQARMCDRDEPEIKPQRNIWGSPPSELRSKSFVGSLVIFLCVVSSGPFESRNSKREWFRD
jgi:hypothetical protein